MSAMTRIEPGCLMNLTLHFTMYVCVLYEHPLTSSSRFVKCYVRFIGFHQHNVTKLQAQNTQLNFSF